MENISIERISESCDKRVTGVIFTGFLIYNIIC